MTAYTNIITGPRRPGEPDGPDEFHLVILDNGRSEILGRALPRRPPLHPLRCLHERLPGVPHIGGGHAYGSVYPGPMGTSSSAVGRPAQPARTAARHQPVRRLFRGLPRCKSTCRRCSYPCAAISCATRITGFGDRLMFRLAAWVLKRPWAYKLATRLAGWFSLPLTDGGWMPLIPPALQRLDRLPRHAPAGREAVPGAVGGPRNDEG